MYFSKSKHGTRYFSKRLWLFFISTTVQLQSQYEVFNAPGFEIVSRTFQWINSRFFKINSRFFFLKIKYVIYSLKIKYINLCFHFQSSLGLQGFYLTSTSLYLCFLFLRLRNWLSVIEMIEYSY